MGGDQKRSDDEMTKVKNTRASLERSEYRATLDGPCASDIARFYGQSDCFEALQMDVADVGDMQRCPSEEYANVIAMGKKPSFISDAHALLVEEIALALNTDPGNFTFCDHVHQHKNVNSSKKKPPSARVLVVEDTMIMTFIEESHSTAGRAHSEDDGNEAHREEGKSASGVLLSKSFLGSSVRNIELRGDAGLFVEFDADQIKGKTTATKHLCFELSNAHELVKALEHTVLFARANEKESAVAAKNEASEKNKKIPSPRQPLCSPVCGQAGCAAGPGPGRRARPGRGY